MTYNQRLVIRWVNSMLFFCFWVPILIFSIFLYAHIAYVLYRNFKWRMIDFFFSVTFFCHFDRFFSPIFGLNLQYHRQYKKDLYIIRHCDIISYYIAIQSYLVYLRYKIDITCMDEITFRHMYGLCVSKSYIRLFKSSIYLYYYTCIIYMLYI